MVKGVGSGVKPAGFESLQASLVSVNSRAYVWHCEDKISWDIQEANILYYSINVIYYYDQWSHKIWGYFPLHSDVRTSDGWSQWPWMDEEKWCKEEMKNNNLKSQQQFHPIPCLERSQESLGAKHHGRLRNVQDWNVKDATRVLKHIFRMGFRWSLSMLV